MKPIAIFAFTAVVLSAAKAQEQPLQLSQALALARANRPSVQAAQLRLTSARLSRRGLGAYPATRLFIGYQNNLALDGTEDDLGLAQPIDIFGRTSASRSVGDAEIARAEAEMRAVLADVQTEVFEAYSEVAVARALFLSAGKNQEIAQKLYDAIKILVEEGKAPGVQLARVGIELDRAKLTAGQRNAEFRAGLQRLSGVLHVRPEQALVEDFASFSVQMIEPSQLPQFRADLLLLAAEIRAGEAEARVARLGSAPELEIQGRRSPWQERNQQYGLRIQLGIPINDFGKARSETAAARTKVEASRKAFADTVRISESELAAARIELEAAQDQADRYQKVVADARALVEKSRMGFVDRAITLIEFLEATRALREVEEAFIEARFRLATAQTSYIKASGTILEVSR